MDVILLYKRFAERWLLTSCSRKKLNSPDLSEEIKTCKRGIMSEYLKCTLPQLGMLTVYKSLIYWLFTVPVAQGSCFKISRP